MPYCNVSQYQKSSPPINIFYHTYGHGDIKVLLIIGLAGTHESWGPQIKSLTGTHVAIDDAELPTIDQNTNSPNQRINNTSDTDTNYTNDDNHSFTKEKDGIEVCCFDNRGMGRSSVPTKKSQYTTTRMAKDALALMDHLSWKKAHVFGHSMGAMIACKLAAMAPGRISSLALLNVTGGGFQCFPKIDRKMISIAIRFLRAKTPEQRAAVDLDTHYTKEYLDECIGTTTRRKILNEEYVKGISSTGMQSNYGFEGQVNACWTHKMTSKELEVIRTAGILVSVIHGRYDIIAQIYYARKLAEKLQPVARMVDIHGGHLVSHERPEEVNQALIELIKAAESKRNPHEWSNLPKKSDGGWFASISFLSYGEGSSRQPILFKVLEKVQIAMLYFIGLFIMIFEHARKIFRSFKPMKFEASLS